MKRFGMLLLAILLVLTLPVHALAEGGDGSGGGSGEALTVGQTSVENGGTIAPEDSITLTFTKNVVNEKVRETNAVLFDLMDADGNPVAIEVLLYDDQIEPEHKRDITIIPSAPLSAGSYTLTAHAGITAKNGTAMAEDYVLSFTVVSPDAPEEAPIEPAAPTEAPTAVPTEAPKSTEAPVSVPEPLREEANAKKAPSGVGFGIVGALVFCGIVAAVVAVLVVKKRRK